MNDWPQSTEVLTVLWRATWQATILAAIVYLITQIGKQSIAPRWRTLLWTAPILRLVLLLVPVGGWSMYTWFEPSSAFSARAPSPSAWNRATSFAPTFAEVGSDSGDRNAFRDSRGVHSLGPAATQHAAELPVADLSQTRASQEYRFSWGAFLVSVWILGVLVAASRWAIARSRLMRLISRGPMASDADILDAVESARRRFGVRRRVRCRITDPGLGPATAGLFRPTILLPAALARELESAQLQTIIDHEIAHVRRWDALLLVLARLARTIHWFNPLAFLLGRRLQSEIELSVDAATLAGKGCLARRSYGQLLIRLAAHPIAPGLLTHMSDSRSDIGRRVEQIVSPARDGRLRSLAFACLLIVLLATGLTDRSLSVAQERPPEATGDRSETTRDRAPDDATHEYFVAGTVTDEATGTPIADAKIQILVKSERDPEKRILHGTTDDRGQYRIAVPMGQVNLWFPALKPGYWLSGDINTKSLVTSPDQPTAKCDLVVQTGPVWHVQVVGQIDDPMLSHLSITELPDDGLRAAYLDGENVSFQKSPESWYGRLDADGKGALTEVGQSRKFVISAGNVVGELIVDPEFDNTQVVSAGPTKSIDNEKTERNDAVLMVDRAGHTATISGVEVTLHDVAPLLTVRVKKNDPVGVQSIRGKVVDTEGNPLPDVQVGLSQGIRGGGSTATDKYVNTNSNGEFHFEVEQTKKPKRGQQVSVTLIKEDYAAKDSPWFDVSESFEEIHAGTIRLEPGYSATVLILDQHGNPAAGAEIEPMGGYALRAQAARADAQGRATLKNLPNGLVGIHATLGEQFKSTRIIVLPEAPDDMSTIRLEPIPAATAAEHQRPTPLAVGKMAPEWQVAQWSDNQPRTLANLRGKTVVLDFWGVWCSPCVGSIPAMQAVAEQYADRDVVFVGIHTADGDVQQINKLKKLKGWTSPSAVDQGTGIQDGLTCKAYGVSGYPTIVIVDPSGKIAYRSDVLPAGAKNRADFIKMMNQLAAANQLKWPDDNAPREEAEFFMNQMQIIMLSQQLDQLLDAP